LLVSPANTKLGVWPVMLVEVVLVEVLLGVVELAIPDEELLKSIQGTATCLPPTAALEEVVPVALELVPEVELVAPAPALPLKERIANSSLPDEGLTIVSLIVPISVPEEPFTWAPVSWLARTAWWLMRPVALRCRLLQSDWLLEAPPYELEPGVVLWAGLVVVLELLLEGSVEEPPAEPDEVCA
jgi:hypothetical protein